MTFSVIIPTFNSNLDKTLLTLKSVIKQEFTDFEIIVVDDASEVDNLEKVGKFLKDSKCLNYKLIRNRENEGTVKNLLSAIKKADGLYIKALGPGDLLYNEKTLGNLNTFMIDSGVSIGFGGMRSYIFEGGKVIEHSFSAPKNKKVYIKTTYSPLLQLRNLLIFGDWISGSTMFFEKTFIQKYLTALCEKAKTKYCEDLIVVLGLLEGISPYYIEKDIIWYEYGSGLSTSGNQTYSDLLYRDHTQFRSFLACNYSSNNVVRKMTLIDKRRRMISKVNNRWIRRLFLSFIDPMKVSFTLRYSVMNKRISRKNETGFLDDLRFLE
ncbi:glycosyltransferase family 2 protein [Mesotoga sp.]|uniref:glycosyltransferase family 2 protein n=1 Tax=Mesotoga sp. TaxID=2053577 RepID=UPI000B0ACE57|nr:glycosyltransferase [Mesotoga sp.]